MREDRRQREQRSAPAPSRHVQPSAEMRVQADKPSSVRQAIEDAAHASRLATQSRELTVGAVEHIRDNEERNADRIEPRTRIPEEMSSGDAEDETRQRYAVRRDARGREGIREPPPHRSEESAVSPLLDDRAFTGVHARRPLRAPPSSSRGLPSLAHP